MYKNITNIVASIFFGESAQNIDHDTQNVEYQDLVHMFSCFLKHESKIFFDSLSLMKENDSGLMQVLLAKCVDLPKIQKILNSANINLKKGQQISNLTWLEQVSSSFNDLVMFVSCMSD